VTTNVRTAMLAAAWPSKMDAPKAASAWVTAEFFKSEPEIRLPRIQQHLGKSRSCLCADTSKVYASELGNIENKSA